jgi:dTDP-4-dehydrorhamnose reductase
LDTGTKAEYDTSWKFQPTYLGHISEVIDQIVQKSISNQTIAVAVNSLKSRYDLAKDILEPFGVTVSPIDAGDTSPTFSENLELLTTLGLPTYDYQTIISKIVEEIRQRERFIL